MKDRRAIALGVAVALVAAGWCYRQSGLTVTADLLAQFDKATQQPGPHVFQTGEVVLNGESRRAVTISASTSASRLTWKRVRIPDGAWLRVDLGMPEDSWTQEGSAVQFLIGASDGRTYEDLAQRTVHPAAAPDDRRWISLTIDLSLYVGEEIDLIFNTRVAGSGAQDSRGAAAAWGTLEIVR